MGAGRGQAFRNKRSVVPFQGMTVKDFLEMPERDRWEVLFYGVVEVGRVAKQIKWLLVWIGGGVAANVVLNLMGVHITR